jgi:hypothetical protein
VAPQVEETSCPSRLTFVWGSFFIYEKLFPLIKMTYVLKNLMSRSDEIKEN